MQPIKFCQVLISDLINVYEPCLYCEGQNMFFFLDHKECIVLFSIFESHSVCIRCSVLLM